MTSGAYKYNGNKQNMSRVCGAYNGMEVERFAYARLAAKEKMSISILWLCIVGQMTQVVLC